MKLLLLLLATALAQPYDGANSEELAELYDIVDGPEPFEMQTEMIGDVPSIEEWPQPGQDEPQVGQVSAVAVDSNGNLHVFHRGSRTWNAQSFDSDNNFLLSGSIPEPTHLVIDVNTGDVLESYGANRFYMPHGLTIDAQDNCWFTDVAMHQVFKIPLGSEEPTLTLGVRMKPGDDNEHFCKPTDVAVAANGDFFVADGYCNARIMKYAPDGKLVAQFGKATESMPPPVGTFAIPHSIALIEDWNVICVADRENQRIQCFTAGLNTGDGKQRTLPAGIALRSANALGYVYAIRAHEHRLFGVINNNHREGLSSEDNQLFQVDLSNGAASAIAPGIENPHALAVDQDGAIYVAEIGPNRVLKIQ